MQDQDQDHELEQDHNEEVAEGAAQNQEAENSALDPQTLENLAAFLTRDNSEPREEHENDDDINKSEANEQHNEVQAHRANSPSAGDRQSRSRSRSRERNHQRWLYCCGKCKKNDKKGKTCICVVPADQRRVSIRPEGCSTCRCHGCSKEDVQLRQDKRPRESVERHEEIMRNGCCKECMKAFSSIGKACVCQVPAAVRKKRIPDSGCPVCGCKGCNPEDTGILKQPTTEGYIPLDIVKRNDHGHTHTHGHGHHMRTNDRRFDSRSVSRSRSRSRPRSRSRSFSGSRSRSRSPSGEQFELRYDNLDNSYIGGFLKNTFNLYLPLIGFGIPQRTYSYINGKPPSH